MNLMNLDEKTRELMLEEFEADVSEGRLYQSNRLTAQGWKAYPDIFRDAIDAGTPKIFAGDIKPLLASTEGTRKVPKNAAETLADGQFNYYYVRAMCRRALDENRELEIYRAKATSNPRPESEAKIGTSPDPEILLSDLLSSPGFADSVPGGPGSKISVKFRN